MPDSSGQAPADALSEVLSPETDKTTDAKAELPTSRGSPPSLPELQAGPLAYVLNPQKTLHHPPVVNYAAPIQHPDPVSIPASNSATASRSSDMPVGNSLTPLLTQRPTAAPQAIPRSTLTPANTALINPSTTSTPMLTPMPTPAIGSDAAPHPSTLFTSPLPTSTDDDLVPLVAVDSLAAVDMAASKTCPAVHQPLLAALPTCPVKIVDPTIAMQQPMAEPSDALDNCDATADSDMPIAAPAVLHSLLPDSFSENIQGCLLGPRPLLTGLHQPVCPLDSSDTANPAAAASQQAALDPSAAQVNSVGVSEHQEVCVAFKPASEPALQPSSGLHCVNTSALAPLVSIASRSNSLTALLQMSAFADGTQLSTALVLCTASAGGQTSGVASTQLERGSHQLSPALMPHAPSAGPNGATHIISLNAAGPEGDKVLQMTALFILIQCRSSSRALVQRATSMHGPQSPTALAVYTAFAGAGWYRSGSIVLSAMCPMMEPANNSKLADCCGEWRDAGSLAEKALQGCSSMLLVGTTTSLMGPPLEAGRLSQGRLALALAALMQLAIGRAP